MKPCKYVIDLKGSEKRDLRSLKRKGKTEVRVADRARILLWADEGVTIEETAHRLGCGRDKVIFWRRRFLEGRTAKTPLLERLQDLPRSGRPPVFTAEQRETVILTTLTLHQAARTDGLTVCTSRDLAQQLSGEALGQSISHSSVVRLWAAAKLKPWRWHYWLTRTDPDLERKSRQICRLYHHPPQDGTLLGFDEKPGIQIIERKYPDLPLHPGLITLREFEYIRHGTLDLLAALNIRTGQVFGRCYPRHRAVELVDFLDRLHHALPQEDYGVLHLVSDNGSTRLAPETQVWRDAHPGRVVWHFLPTHASWLNQIEIWFSILQRKCLARGAWCDYTELERHILAFIRIYNRLSAHPFRWVYKGLPLAE
jgi:transposase-like protein/transposase